MRLQEEWEREGIPVTLKILASPYREITRPILDYVQELRRDNPQDLVTVFIPEYVVGHWWEQLLHNQSALRLKSRLLFTPGVMVTSVPWQLKSSELVADRDEGPGVRPGSISSVGDERIVEIGPIAHGGHFIAHSDGRTLFVRHAITGERVRVRVTDVNRKMVRADAIEVIDAAPDRVPAPCPWAHADGCGGCDFQHIAVSGPATAQAGGPHRRPAPLRPARRRRTSRVSTSPSHELPGHPDGLHWRTRMTWATDAEGHVGLRRYRRHDVIPVDRCLIAAEGVDVPGDAPTGKVTHEVRDRTWRMERGDFWQVHDALPEALVDTVLEFGQPQPGQSWWDLYAGAGLFAAFLGEAVGRGGRRRLHRGGRGSRQGRPTRAPRPAPDRPLRGRRPHLARHRRRPPRRRGSNT